MFGLYLLPMMMAIIWKRFGRLYVQWDTQILNKVLFPQIDEEGDIIRHPCLSFKPNEEREIKTVKIQISSWVNLLYCIRLPFICKVPRSDGPRMTLAALKASESAKDLRTGRHCLKHTAPQQHSQTTKGLYEDPSDPVHALRTHLAQQKVSIVQASIPEQNSVPFPLHAICMTSERPFYSVASFLFTCLLPISSACSLIGIITSCCICSCTSIVNKYH